MKRYITFIALLVCTIATAQSSDDVLRYSSENLQGTARFQAMGGAFGSLGGDLSALNINPAGAAIFNNGLLTISGTLYNNDNTANYFGTNRNATDSSVDINQAGGTMVFKSANPEAGWNKMVLAINYDVTQNFNSQVLIEGISAQGIDNYFLNFADGTVPLGDIQLFDGELIENAYSDIGEQQGFVDQQAFLGFQSAIIDPVDFDDDNNTAYFGNANYTNVNQTLRRNTTGYNSKFTVNFASQYKEKISLGASLNFHNILYDRFDQFTETGYDADSEIQRVTFDNLLLTQGSGFSLNVGGIAKLNDLVRIGASYQSPTWYRLTDELSQRISSDSEFADPNINFIGFNQVNFFPSYRLKTPAKLTGSAALVFGKGGLLSIDYSYQDMSQAELRPTSDSNFNTVNNEVENTFGAVSTIRVGGEYKIERFSLRAGYRYEQSPYVNANVLGDVNGISGGLGYDFGGSRLDFALSRIERDSSQLLFDTGLDTPAQINGINTNATLSYTMNF